METITKKPAAQVAMAAKAAATFAANQGREAAQAAAHPQGKPPKKSLTQRRVDVAPANAARRARPPPAPVPIDIGDELDGIRLLTKPDLIERVGVPFVTSWEWMRQGRFPRSRALGGRSVWIKSEVEQWMASLPVRPLKGDEA